MNFKINCICICERQNTVQLMLS